MKDLSQKYNLDGPLILLTISHFFSNEKICSRNDSEIFCLSEISDKLIGLFPVELMAISTKEVTANLPLDVSFIYNFPFVLCLNYFQL